MEKAQPQQQLLTKKGATQRQTLSLEAKNCFRLSLTQVDVN